MRQTVLLFNIGQNVMNTDKLQPKHSLKNPVIIYAHLMLMPVWNALSPVINIECSSLAAAVGATYGIV